MRFFAACVVALAAGAAAAPIVVQAPANTPLWTLVVSSNDSDAIRGPLAIDKDGDVGVWPGAEAAQFFTSDYTPTHTLAIHYDDLANQLILVGANGLLDIETMTNPSMDTVPKGKVAEWSTWKIGAERGVGISDGADIPSRRWVAYPAKDNGWTIALYDGYSKTDRKLTTVTITALPAGFAPAATEPAAPEPAAPEPAASEPAASEPAASEPAAPEPTAYEPAASEPAVSEPAASEPAASEPVASGPATFESGAVPAPDSGSLPALENPPADAAPVAAPSPAYPPVLPGGQFDTPKGLLPPLLPTSGAIMPNDMSPEFPDYTPAPNVASQNTPSGAVNPQPVPMPNLPFGSLKPQPAPRPTPSEAAPKPTVATPVPSPEASPKATTSTTTGFEWLTNLFKGLSGGVAGPTIATSLPSLTTSPNPTTSTTTGFEWLTNPFKSLGESLTSIFAPGSAPAPAPVPREPAAPKVTKKPKSSDDEDDDNSGFFDFGLGDDQKVA